MQWQGEPSTRIEVTSKTSLAGSTVSIDSFFTALNRDRKRAFMDALERQAVGADEKVSLSYDMVGSNIAYQLDVARGETIFGLTDAVGGPWDWRIGYAIITEAGGVMVDGQTGEKPTNASTVVIYGNQEVVSQMIDASKTIYAGYQGFAKK